VREERTTSGKPVERSTFTPAGGVTLGAPRPKPVGGPITDSIRPVGGVTDVPPPPPLDGAAMRPAPASYRVESVKARVGDDWQTVSTRYYGNDRCTEALRQFNSDYPHSTPRMKAEGLFSPGETIYIPATDKLITDYKALIRPEASARPVPPPTEATTRGFDGTR
jgi:hypothetical protein